MDDLMWATPGGERWLVVADDDVADFVGGIYDFDRVVVSPLQVRHQGRTLELDAPDLGLDLRMEGGRGWPIPVPRRRPPWFTRRVEAPIARRLMGVEAYGVSPTGVREWYQASRYRPVVAARASLHRADLGSLGRLEPAVRFGFSEPPRRPSLVEVTTVLELPAGGRSPRPTPG
ncbi:MAG TPA: hypothetical protein VM942_05560 [Acidimicrobiales bacterium]|nr:hypothetical protein [Acidimicrobiales bacterium]